MPFCPVIFHQAHKNCGATEWDRMENERKQYVHTFNKTNKTTTDSRCYFDKWLLKPCVLAFLYGYAMKFIRLYTKKYWIVWWVYSSNMCEQEFVQSTTHVCNNWQIKRNGKSFFSFLKHESRNIYIEEGTCVFEWWRMNIQQEAHDFFCCFVWIAKWHVKEHFVEYLPIVVVHDASNETAEWSKQLCAIC